MGSWKKIAFITGLLAIGAVAYIYIWDKPASARDNKQVILKFESPNDTTNEVATENKKSYSVSENGDIKPIINDEEKPAFKVAPQSNPFNTEAKFQSSITTNTTSRNNQLFVTKTPEKPNHSFSLDERLLNANLLDHITLNKRADYFGMLQLIRGSSVLYGADNYPDVKNIYKDAIKTRRLIRWPEKKEVTVNIIGGESAKDIKEGIRKVIEGKKKEIKTLTGLDIKPTAFSPADIIIATPSDWRNGHTKDKVKLSSEYADGDFKYTHELKILYKDPSHLYINGRVLPLFSILVTVNEEYEITNVYCELYRNGTKRASLFTRTCLSVGLGLFNNFYGEQVDFTWNIKPLGLLYDERLKPGYSEEEIRKAIPIPTNEE